MCTAVTYKVHDIERVGRVHEAVSVQQLNIAQLAVVVHDFFPCRDINDGVHRPRIRITAITVSTTARCSPFIFLFASLAVLVLGKLAELRRLLEGAVIQHVCNRCKAHTAIDAGCGLRYH